MLEKGTATHFSILAWRIPWTEETGRLQSMDSQRVGHSWVIFTFFFFCHRVVLTMYLKLFIFLLAVSIPASVSSSPALGLMYSAYNLNKQGDNIQTWHIPFLIESVRCSLFGFNCCILTCIQVFQEAGKAIWYPHLFKNFPQFVVIHTDKGFSIVNRAKSSLLIVLVFL